MVDLVDLVRLVACMVDNVKPPPGRQKMQVPPLLLLQALYSLCAEPVGRLEPGWPFDPRVGRVAALFDVEHGPKSRHNMLQELLLLPQEIAPLMPPESEDPTESTATGSTNEMVVAGGQEPLVMRRHGRVTASHRRGADISDSTSAVAHKPVRQFSKGATDSQSLSTLALYQQLQSQVTGTKISF